MSLDLSIRRPDRLPGRRRPRRSAGCRVLRLLGIGEAEVATGTTTMREGVLCRRKTSWSTASLAVDAPSPDVGPRRQAFRGSGGQRRTASPMAQGGTGRGRRAPRTRWAGGVGRCGLPAGRRRGRCGAARTGRHLRHHRWSSGPIAHRSSHRPGLGGAHVPPGAGARCGPARRGRGPGCRSVRRPPYRRTPRRRSDRPAGDRGTWMVLQSLQSAHRQRRTVACHRLYI